MNKRVIVIASFIAFYIVIFSWALVWADAVTVPAPDIDGDIWRDGDMIDAPDISGTIKFGYYEDEIFNSDEIMDVLERCREFIDKHEPDSGVYFSDWLYRSPPTAEEIAEQKVKDAQERLEKLKREIKLANDLDDLLRRMNEYFNP